MLLLALGLAGCSPALGVYPPDIINLVNALVTVLPS